MEEIKLCVWGILTSLVLLMRVVRGAEVKGLASCNFPAVYNFGDSNSDTGSYSKATDPALPPAGRVCDGRLIIDFIAEELRIEYLSPYLKDPVGSNFRHGANFAVGGATISPQARPFHLAVQTKEFSEFKARAINIYKQGKNTKRLPRPEDFSKALYILDIGQNDMYLSMLGAPPTIIPGVINEFVVGFQSLYDEGARVFWIHNVGPNGCLPAAQHNIPGGTHPTFDKNGCINSWNERVMEYNKQLKDMVIKLREDFPEAVITYVDIYAAKYKLINNAHILGFTDPLKRCSVEGEKDKNGTICENPSMYISWDGMHYTEAANHWVAKSILNGTLSDPPVSIANACHRNESM